MGGGVNVPGPSAEERALQKAQKEMIDFQRGLLERQDAQQRVLIPFMAQQEGYDVVVDENGMITSISKRFDPLEEQDKEIRKAFNDRTLAALKGELPVDPGLERDIGSQREALVARLGAQFGPGASTASPAIEALQRFEESANVLREGARTGQLTLAEQLGIVREQQSIYRQQTAQDALRQTTIGDRLMMAGAFGQTANNYGRAQAPYIEQRRMETQAAISNQGFMGGLLGAGIGAIGAMFSDEDMKGDLIQIGSHPTGIPIYVYTRLDTGERMIGMLAQDVEQVRPGAVWVKNGYLTVSYGDV